MYSSYCCIQSVELKHEILDRRLLKDNEVTSLGRLGCHIARPQQIQIILWQLSEHCGENIDVFGNPDINYDEEEEEVEPQATP